MRPRCPVRFSVHLSAYCARSFDSIRLSRPQLRKGTTSRRQALHRYERPRRAPGMRRRSRTLPRAPCLRAGTFSVVISFQSPTSTRCRAISCPSAPSESTIERGPPETAAGFASRLAHPVHRRRDAPRTRRERSRCRSIERSENRDGQCRGGFESSRRCPRRALRPFEGAPTSQESIIKNTQHFR